MVDEKHTANDTEKVIEVGAGFQIADELLNYIPQESAELYNIVPLRIENQTLYIGAIDPKNLDVRDALNFIASRNGISYKLQKISKGDLERLLQQYSQAGTAVSEALEQIEAQSDIILGVDEEQDVNDIDVIKEEAPVIKLVSTILSEAVRKNASDIHVEPHVTFSLVRYRLDGILHETLRFPRKVHNPLIARIKILSNLRLDERRRPQDGRFSSVFANRRIDFRVAVFPTSDGEKVTLRILDKQKGLLSLKHLGLTQHAEKKLLEAVNRPYGLILAAGPTGAGKTTTMYALLNILDKKTKNIVSLEDPVEYSLEGISQSNIRPELGYTFANGLRSILRGDPDQMFVGEIRDRETAQLAIQAALTGHTVFSTIHTNTAIGAVSRLINFGIDPFLLAPTLSLVIGQRMARRIAGDGKELPVNDAMRKRLDGMFQDLPKKYHDVIPEFTSFKEVVPTKESPSGMSGRIGVFEIFNMNDKTRTAILENPSEQELYKIARQDGMVMLAEDAIIKGLQGVIPYSEIVKISSERAFGDIQEYGTDLELDGESSVIPESIVEKVIAPEDGGKKEETHSKNTQKNKEEFQFRRKIQKPAAVDITKGKEKSIS